MNLPANVYAVKDRHGKTRFRFRKAGLPSRMVHGQPGTEQFAQSYDSCFDPNYRPAPRRRPRPWILADLPKFVGQDFVYFIGTGRGPVKIGTTVNLRARLKKLQTGHPARLKVLACIPGGADVEAAYHQLFAAHHVHGEWFAGEAIKDEIRRLRTVARCPTLNPANVDFGVQPQNRIENKCVS